MPDPLSSLAALAFLGAPTLIAAREIDLTGELGKLQSVASTAVRPAVTEGMRALSPVGQQREDALEKLRGLARSGNLGARVVLARLLEAGFAREDRDGEFFQLVASIPSTESVSMSGALRAEIHGLQRRTTEYRTYLQRNQGKVLAVLQNDQNAQAWSNQALRAEEVDPLVKAVARLEANPGEDSPGVAVVLGFSANPQDIATTYRRLMVRTPEILAVASPMAVPFDHASLGRGYVFGFSGLRNRSDAEELCRLTGVSDCSGAIESALALLVQETPPVREAREPAPADRPASDSSPFASDPIALALGHGAPEIVAESERIAVPLPKFRPDNLRIAAHDSDQPAVAAEEPLVDRGSADLQTRSRDLATGPAAQQTAVTIAAAPASAIIASALLGPPRSKQSRSDRMIADTALNSEISGITDDHVASSAGGFIAAVALQYPKRGRAARNVEADPVSAAATDHNRLEVVRVAAKGPAEPTGPGRSVTTAQAEEWQVLSAPAVDVPVHRSARRDGRVQTQRPVQRIGAWSHPRHIAVDRVQLAAAPMTVASSESGIGDAMVGAELESTLLLPENAGPTSVTVMAVHPYTVRPEAVSIAPALEDPRPIRSVAPTMPAITLALVDKTLADASLPAEERVAVDLAGRPPRVTPVQMPLAVNAAAIDRPSQVERDAAIGSALLVTPSSMQDARREDVARPVEALRDAPFVVAEMSLERIERAEGWSVPDAVAMMNATISTASIVRSDAVASASFYLDIDQVRVESADNRLALLRVDAQPNATGHQEGVHEKTRSAFPVGLTSATRDVSAARGAAGSTAELALAAGEGEGPCGARGAVCSSDWGGFGHLVTATAIIRREDSEAAGRADVVHGRSADPSVPRGKRTAKTRPAVLAAPALERFTIMDIPPHEWARIRRSEAKLMKKLGLA